MFFILSKACGLLARKPYIRSVEQYHIFVAVLRSILDPMEWWIAQEQDQQVFWSIALVATLLLGIFAGLSLFGYDLDQDARESGKGRKWYLTDPRPIFVFFTLFGWVAVISSYYLETQLVVLALAAATGAVGAILPWRIKPLLTSRIFDKNAARSSTGQVLRSIPPHRNGFGKVHLNLHAAPFEMDALTAGEELPAGSPVRVVEVIDEGVLLVEAIDSRKEKDRPPNLKRKAQTPRPPRS